MNTLLFPKRYSSSAISSIVTLLFLTGMSCTRAEPAYGVDSQPTRSLWARDNLVAWCVGTRFDDKKRGPEERAQMLARLGFRYYAYMSDNEEFRITEEKFAAELEALKRHGITLLGLFFPFDADDPRSKPALDIFKRHNVHPRLWVPLALLGIEHRPPKPWDAMPPKEREKAFNRMTSEQEAKLYMKFMRQDLNNVPQGQDLRVKHEADRIEAIVKLAAPYGSKVDLYNHNGWSGMMTNQVAILERLEERGVTDVGIVYNFFHARDELHDDTTNFPPLWRKIRPYVVAVNISGTYTEGTHIYPSQGDRELEMMRTIEESGWTGPIGLCADKGGDAEADLVNNIIGLDWLAAELRQTGSGGPPPFPPVR
jgi:sugar phosphate isomerase/epimerase